jgi:hypothetical protein
MPGVIIRRCNTMPLPPRYLPMLNLPVISGNIHPEKWIAIKINGFGTTYSLAANVRVISFYNGK